MLLAYSPQLKYINSRLQSTQEKLSNWVEPVPAVEVREHYIGFYAYLRGNLSNTTANSPEDRFSDKQKVACCINVWFFVILRLCDYVSAELQVVFAVPVNTANSNQHLNSPVNEWRSIFLANSDLIKPKIDSLEGCLSYVLENF